MCGGSLAEDECGICGGSGTGIYEDCDGNCLDGLVRDCDNVCGGSLVEDDCGVCGGDNSQCSGCIDVYAVNYNPQAQVSDGSCIYPTYGCTDSNALNYDPSVTYSNGNCDYEPEIGFWFGDIDEDAGTMEIYFSNDDSDLSTISFTISGAEITGAFGGISDAVGASVTTSSNSFSATGNFNIFNGLLTVLEFNPIERRTEYCFGSTSVNIPSHESVKITKGGCSVFIGTLGGQLTNSDINAVIDIPAGALASTQNLSVGPVTAPLSNPIIGGTGFNIGATTSTRPFGTIIDDDAEPVTAGFDSGVDFSVNLTRTDDVYVCYLEDASDTDWTVIELSLIHI